MKKNTNYLFNSVFGLFLLFFVTVQKINAQVQNNGILHVASSGYIYLGDGQMTFGSSSTTSTSKTIPYASNDGKIVLGVDAVFSTNGANAKYVNGYAETKSTSTTTLAIGSSAIYAPINVTSSAGTGVHAAYFDSSPLTAFSGGLSSSLTDVANNEYWIIKGASAVISLSWRASSGLSSFAYPDVTIVGYNTSSSKWEKISSAINSTSVFGGASTLANSGSITSDAAVTLSNYAAFGIGMKGVECTEIVTSSGNTKTWNGTSWVGGVPTLADPAELSAPYSAGSFVCNSLNLNTFDVTLSGTESLEVVHGVSGTGKIVLSSEASLVQRDSNPVNAPTIELTKTTRPIKRFDYVYWGSPVTSNVFSQIDNAQVAGNALGAFDLKYKYVSGVVGTAGGWQPLTGTTVGKGFITRVKEQAPFVDAVASGQINLKFTGTANNGDIIVPVLKVSGNDTSSRNNNLLANPYPSAIDANKFLTQNNDLLDGVIYLWRANTSNNGQAGQQYAVADYIAYTKAGSTGYAGSGTAASVNFDGFIASGQGFKVKALASGDVSFTNCMRVVSNNTQFYRYNPYATTTTSVVDRFKVNLQTAEGIANQVLVAYLPVTSLEYDPMYDAELLSVSANKMYSILDNTTRKLAINARPTFENTDQVMVGFTKVDTSSSQMSIHITDTEGVFANGQTPIYLHDTHLDTYHNFANGAYSFTTSSQEDNSRFKIVYQGASLNNPSFSSVDVVTMINDRVLSIRASSDIEEVTVFDLMGRMILNSKPSDISSSFNSAFNQAVGVYLIKVKLTNGQVVTNKLINKN